MVLKLLPCLLLVACLGTSPPTRLATPTPIALLVHLEGADGRAAQVPASLIAAIEQSLAERNLVAHATVVTLGDVRTSDERLEALRRASDTPWVMLVEARARFFSQLAGRYRWDLEVKTSVAQARTDTMETTARLETSELTVAAFLLFEHEREPQALAAVTKQLVDDVGALVDRVIK